jgi:hypothetical protein
VAFGPRHMATRRIDANSILGRLEFPHGAKGEVPRMNVTGTLPLQGWSCPHCGKAHAPTVLTCPEPARANLGYPPIGLPDMRPLIGWRNPAPDAAQGIPMVGVWHGYIDAAGNLRTGAGQPQ